MIKEKCGLCALIGAQRDACIGSKLYKGLSALQHRGQESAGAVIIDSKATLIRNRGLVRDVFFQFNGLSNYGGQIALGHVRYGKDGETDKETQPIMLNSSVGEIYLAYNGCVTNCSELIDELPQSYVASDGRITDIESIGYTLIKNIEKTNDLTASLKKLLSQVKGAYTLIVLIKNTIYCLRDKFGFRPLCYGRTNLGQFVFASETCALNAVSATIEGEIRPGELVVCNGNKITFDTEFCGKVSPSPCCFEYFYFADRSSVLSGNLVSKIRCDAGRLLARKKPVSCDLVIGVPDSGIDSAKGYAKEANLPYAEGFIRNTNIRRTFIVPNQEERERLVQAKLLAIPSVVKGKEIVVVDDSIVRGTTAIHIVKLLRDAGAKKIHMRISSPKFIYDCPYGTDIGKPETLIAYNRTTEEIAQVLGVDTLEYLEPLDIAVLVGGGFSTMCMACFNGEYPDVDE